MSYPPEILDKAKALIGACAEAGIKTVTAESCTGGLLGGALTAVAGSSAVVDRGFVTYSNAAKAQLLGVPVALLKEHGAVSEPVARAMAEGALRALGDTALSAGITGIAGPGGGTADKPVGLVHIAASRTGGPTLHARNIFSGDREAVRLASVAAALDLMHQALNG